MVVKLLVLIMVMSSPWIILSSPDLLIVVKTGTPDLIVMLIRIGLIWMKNDDR